MPVERRGQVICVMVNLANWQQEEPTGCGGGRQFSMDDTSRVNREVYARFCERLGVKFPGPTRRALDNRYPYRDRQPVRRLFSSLRQIRRVAVDLIRHGSRRAGVTFGNLDGVP